MTFMQSIICWFCLTVMSFMLLAKGFAILGLLTAVCIALPCYLYYKTDMKNLYD